MSGFSMRNCPKCGNVFTFVKNPICRECQQKEDEIFETVRQYLKEHNDKTIEEVAEATDVSVKKILRYIKEGKIDVSTNENIKSACENCGKPVTSGRYCDSCASKISKNLTSNISKPTTESSKPKSVMYTQQRKK